MADPRAHSLRSWLYVPGDREDVLGKAFSRGADAVILDVEDAVAPDRKPTARGLVGAALDSAPRNGSPSVWVRVNATDLAADIRAVVHPALAGVVLAKADLDRIAELDELLNAAETGANAAQDIAVVPLIETARGLAEVAAIARGRRVRNLALGEADLAAELGIDQHDDTAVAVVRMPLVVASAAAGILAPTGPTSTNYRDMEALRASTRTLVRQGFRARSAIHPAQVGVINDVLTPSPAEVAHARAQVTAFEAAGGGAARGADGIMVDAATVRAARDVLARAAAAGINEH